jgi:hypothetical protein
MIEAQAKKRGIRMSFPRFDHPCFVNADRTRVKQILINLFSNAIKYNQAGGSVAVEYAASPRTAFGSASGTGVPIQICSDGVDQPHGGRHGHDVGFEDDLKIVVARFGGDGFHRPSLSSAFRAGSVHYRTQGSGSWRVGTR